MKRVSFGGAGTLPALLFAAVSCALAPPAVGAQQSPAPATAEAAAPVLNRAQVDALLARPAEVLVLDVRRADEISTIGGFPVYFSIQPADLERSLPFIPRDRTIVTVSNHAARAAKAAALLTARGFRVAGAVGVEAYAAEGGTLTGKAAASPARGAAPSQPGSHP